MSEAPYASVINLQRLLELHALGLRVCETVSPPPDFGCLYACMGNAWTAEGYQSDDSDQPAGFAFACYLSIYIAQNHCARDGNKRLAWLALLDVLWHYELSIKATNQEAKDMFEEAITKHWNGRDLAEWLIGRLCAFGDEPERLLNPPPR